jgi:hypothetical protein
MLQIASAARNHLLNRQGIPSSPQIRLRAKIETMRRRIPQHVGPTLDQRLSTCRPGGEFCVGTKHKKDVQLSPHYLLAVAVEGSEEAGWLEGKHCARIDKRFISVSKIKKSTATEDMNAIPKQEVFSKEV